MFQRLSIFYTYVEIHETVFDWMQLLELQFNSIWKQKVLLNYECELRLEIIECQVKSSQYR